MYRWLRVSAGCPPDKRMFGGGEPRQRGARESAHGGWSAAEGGGAASGLPGCIARHWQARGAYAASMIEGLAGATLHAMSHLDGDEA